MSMTTCECRSPQEQRLYDKIEGREDRFRKTHPRVFRLLERFEGQKPRIDIERALYFTQSMQETEGQPLVLRWAKALMHIARNMTVYVQEDQLLLGRAGCDGRYGILYPELDGDFLDIAVRDLPTRKTSPATITPEDARRVVEEIAPYWKGKTYHEALNAALPAEVHKLTYDDPEGLISRFIVNETSSFRSSIQWVHDYEKILKRGFNSIKKEAREKLAALDPLSAKDDREKRPFLEAVMIVCDAIVLWAKRHAVLAREMAEKESDPVRKAELLRMAENAEHVPGEPARDFWEACQSQWFTQMFSRIEQKTGTTISNGRMDQYFQPYYKQDREAGKITEAQAMELLECMWVGMAEFIDMYISPTGGAFNEGYAHWEAVTVGGQTPDGRDASNDLTYLILKSKREFPLHYPDLAARIHSRAPERYLWDVAETIKYGSGFPKLINDEEIVPLYVSKGATFEEALDYAVSGCTEARMPNRDTYTSGGAYINFAAAVEMVLRNGRMKKYGDQKLGVETGDPRSFTTWDQFWNAYVEQHLLFLKTAFTQQYIINKLRAEHFAQPMGSAMHDLCMKHCIDLHQEQIPEGINLGYFEYMGLGTVVDSLAAVKKLVFEEKKLSMDKLIAAIDADFEGYEDVRALLRSAPCYGNNDEYADAIGRDIDRISVEYGNKYSMSDLGIHNDVRYVPFTSHVPFGKVVSATPNGRTDGFPLSDGSSASHGADVNGPTAVLLSNCTTKNMGLRDRAARMLNIKFTPKCVEGEQGTEKLVSFIRTFCDLKLWHVQFNVVNKGTLVAAQKDPQKYRNLIVRIAGYSAYFVDLSPDLQNDLIARTEHDVM
ncbi:MULTISPECIES: (2S)-3-sulfopropanediol dehydratase [Desulfovibrio]|uniref:Isethionate sulfite-lyase n=3 Tax=Desulfovibrio TaxID=872 RepID=ISLA_DESDA|nr:MULTISPECIES: glycyl radical protein [Desulfovibrio]B8J0R1.1 RecName: Full=Isethionate sulfite-lyase; AltName: Full=Glycyl radical enzyme IslA; Short=GRE IslA [Desulfovibrio desulfuricans ATCC 27774]ATD81014.1 glycyl radical protein [Desulfovibrio sp. G11]SFW72879.1 formate C-acetyltransferase [Desulfovibrio desulfuricans]SPD36599.1 Pyruvate formate-lyase domain profile, phage ribonucleoside-triphosphate reductase associated [Desulfovibrio sp. G11]